MITMSRVIFWSPLHGQGQTGNLHIISIIMSLLCRKKVLMMRTHFAMNNFEEPLTGRRPEEFFRDIGMDAAVMYSKMDCLTGGILESCCITFSGTNLLLLPGTEIMNYETYERDICSHLSRMIENAEKYVDVVMVDANCGDDEMSFRLMEEADVIIVNLTQKEYAIRRLFTGYGELLDKHKNIFYLFGNYDRNLGCNMVNFRRKYSRYVNSRNLGAIPYCSKIADAQNECRILDMLEKELAGRKETDEIRLKKIRGRVFMAEKIYYGETDYFINQACRTTVKIMEMMDTAGKTAKVGRSRT